MICTCGINCLHPCNSIGVPLREQNRPSRNRIWCFFCIFWYFFVFFIFLGQFFSISLVFLVTRSEPPSGSRVGRGGLTAGLESSKTCHSPVAVGFACRQVTHLLSCRSCCPPLSCRLQCPAHAAPALKKIRLYANLTLYLLLVDHIV